MSGIDSDWTEAVAEAKSSSGRRILWQCQIEDKNRRHMWADYSPDENLRLEVAHRSQTLTVTLGAGDKTWTIDLKHMTQKNDKTETIRCVRRTVEVAF